MFKEQNVNAIIGILWGLAVYFNLSNLDPMTLNVLAIWAVSVNRLYRHFNTVSYTHLTLPTNREV